MTPDQSRLEADRAAPRLVALWQALTALKTPLMFLQSGAHPDDEISDMLAALRFRDGIGLAYVCSTRGEGGQNDIGRARGAALGALRTAEMEAAAARLDLWMLWLSEGPEDPITDFGFSKSGEETLGRWGRDRTLRRFVEVVRKVKPDILCPTFLDVPGQHGHHRAMTALAHEVMGTAADPAFVTEGAAPWRVAKLYLPAWSGAGQAYDDDLPPPPATVTVPGDGRDPVTGWPWGRIGQHSRAMHRTQGMGRWPVEARDWPLHLVDGGAEAAITDGLPVSLADLDLAEAQEAMDAARDAFPDTAAIARHAARALHLLRAATPAPEHAHRVAAKVAQLFRVLWLASGAEVRGAAGADWIAPGEAVAVQVETHAGEAEDVAATLTLPDGWTQADGTLRAEAMPEPYPVEWHPLAPPAPALDVIATVAGESIALRLPLDRTPSALPPGVTLEPQADILNGPARRLPLRLDPPDARLTLPEGWTLDGCTLTLPDDARGHHDLPVTRDGTPAFTVTRLHAPHTAPRALARPAILRLAVIDAALPDRRVAYVGAGHDRVGHWMGRMGLDVTAPDNDALIDRLPETDSIVIGIFALRFRPGLSALMPRLHDWVRAGGTLVTLYHRPWDDWDADRTPPARLEIGQPSLRWRVTDPEAEVTHLAPDHPVLTGPNRIGPQDWKGWDKERGLYFAKSWDDAYVPLLAMSDPGEAPLHGALLSAEIGKGRHSHCALILHHQMEALVPGAFHLMANLVA